MGKKIWVIIMAQTKEYITWVEANCLSLAKIISYLFVFFVLKQATKSVNELFFTMYLITMTDLLISLEKKDYIKSGFYRIDKYIYVAYLFVASNWTNGVNPG